MSEQDSRADDFPRWLAGQGTDAYALAWVGEDNDPLRWMTAPAPAVGRTGADRPGGDPSRPVLQEITHGRSETLRRWLELEGDSTDEPLAIIGTADGRLREYTPGELVAHQLRVPGNGDVQLTQELADWVYRRQAQAPQGLEFGWTAAAAAWSWYMRDVAVALPPSVLARSLALAGEEDEAVGELMVATTLTLAGLYDRLEHGHHDGRAGFVDDWHAIEALAADVPELREPAGWFLDQIALRDASAQQLRAVLEPDITDYLHDRTISDQQPDAAPPRLDGPRTAHRAPRAGPRGRPCLHRRRLLRLRLRGAAAPGRLPGPGARPARQRLRPRVAGAVGHRPRRRAHRHRAACHRHRHRR
ncbi:hypothetical protein [Streptomyces sp. NPDC001621]|uniref:hypothetical protein n=1 Tax=Streptomyces sp. NPDC001621 TaxID=3364594 RepID=UPI0036869F4E